MKVNRSLLFTAVAVVLAVCSGLLLSGCASTADPTEAGPETAPPPPPGGSQRTVLEGQSSPAPRVETATVVPREATGGNPQVRPAPVAGTAGSGAKPRLQQAGPATGGARVEHSASPAGQAAASVAPQGPEENGWDRAVSFLGALVALALIWRFAFWLARLPRRRREAVRRPGNRPLGVHAGVFVSQ